MASKATSYILAVVFCFILLSGCEQSRPAEVIEVPRGFRGWVLIAWGVAGYPELPRDGRKLIELIPGSGVLITSSKQNFGVAADEFHVVDSSGRQIANTGNVFYYYAVTGSKGTDPHALQFTEFFVGTPADAEAEKNGEPEADAKIDEVFRIVRP